MGFYCLFSSVSSALNSLAAVFLEDIIKPMASVGWIKEFSDNTGVWISKGIGEIITMIVSHVVKNTFNFIKFL